MPAVVDFILSEATPDDAEEVVALLNAIRKESSIDPEEKFWLSAEEEREVIIEHKAKGTGQIILARVKKIRDIILKWHVIIL